MSRHILVLGGARSGKSAFAEQRATAHEQDRLYIATAEARDDEMRIRVAEHRKRRGDSWRTIEEPIRLPQILRGQCAANRFVLVDCITLWISNLMLSSEDVGSALAELCELVPRLEGSVAFVSNEVGQGIVPANDLARRFRDEAGFANQKIAAACEEVYLLVAGLPLKIKG